MRTRVLALLLALVTASAVRGMFAPQEMVPVDRLLKTAEAYRVKTKDSAEARYLIARIHYLAFDLKAAGVPVWPSDRDGKPSVPGHGMVESDQRVALYTEARRLAKIELSIKGDDVPDKKRNAFYAAVRKKADELEKDDWKPPAPPSEQQLLKHAETSLTLFRQLLKEEPTNGLYHLGLACLIERFDTWKKAVDPNRLPPALTAVSIMDARAAYLAAFRASYPEDSKLEELPISGIGSLVSYEAAQSFIRLSTTESAELKEAQEIVQKIKGLPTGLITPVLFSLTPVADIDALLAPETVVDFDLRGYGTRERWPWLKPETALLVWDPERTGVITSARQLFGGYTFQLFRANGYDALAALDDDGDGFLTGDELAGIRAWCDADSDGRSSPAEVRDLADLGIVSLAVRASGRDGIHLKSDGGVRFRDGRTLPTWDWFTEPVPGAEPACETSSVASAGSPHAADVASVSQALAGG